MRKRRLHRKQLLIHEDQTDFHPLFRAATYLHYLDMPSHLLGDSNEVGKRGAFRIVNRSLQLTVFAATSIESGLRRLVFFKR